MNDLEQQALRDKLRQSERNLTPLVTEQLTEARRLALKRVKTHSLPRLLMPATGVVMASVVAAVLIFTPFTAQQVPSTGNNIPLENAEFYEDLDFYNWLAENAPEQRS